MRCLWRMRIGIVVLSLVSIAALGAEQKAQTRGLGHFEIPTWFKLSFRDLPTDVREAAARHKRLLIYFGQDGCPYCAELINHHFGRRYMADYTQKHFDVLEINIWGNRKVTDLSGEKHTEKSFAERNKIWFTPTLRFLDERGAEVLRINGYLPPERLILALRYVAERREADIAYKDFVANHRSQTSPDGLTAQPFFLEPPYHMAGQKKPLMILFERIDCPECNTLHREVVSRPETLRLIEQFDMIRLDVASVLPIIIPTGASTTVRAWTETLGVDYAPTAVFFDHGREVVRITTVLKAFHVQSVMD